MARRRARLVGIDATPIADHAQIELAVQRDATGEVWRARVLAENGDHGHMPATGRGAGWRRFLGR